MRIVVDPNVLVSGLISPDGPPGMILNMVTNESLQVCYDSRVLAEYREVLERAEFNLSANRVAGFLTQVIASGEGVLASPVTMSMPDPDDILFLEVALTANAECLITGNLRHFPLSCRKGMRVLSPAEFLQFYRGQQDRSIGFVKNSADEYRVSKRIKRKKAKIPSLRNVRPMSFTEFTRKIDGTRNAGDVDWTPEEVERVIRSIRREKKALKQTKERGKAARC